MQHDNRYRRYRVPIGAYATAATLMVVLQHVANRVTRTTDYRFLPWHGLRYYVDGLSQFDGPEYAKIAAHGYSYVPGQRSLVVWFPLYPMAMRLVERATHDYLVAGIAVTLVGGLLAALAYWRWLTVQGLAGRTRLIAFAVLGLYPYSYYLYGVVYSDALFLAGLVSAFVLVDRRRYLLGGLVGILVTATRSNGVAVAPALFVLALQRDGVLTVPAGARGLVARFAVPLRFDRSKLRAAAFAPLLSLAGIGAYMTYLWVRFGSPIIFATNERTYHPGGRPVLKIAVLVRWYHFTDNPTYALTITAQGILALLVLLCVPAVARRFGFAYGLFVATLVAIPTISTEDFIGTGRYLIAAFPVAALVGEWLATRTVAPRVWLPTSGIAMFLLGMGFSRSWYLA